MGGDNFSEFTDARLPCEYLAVHGSGRVFYIYRDLRWQRERCFRILVVMALM